jgi:hypothetical protein
VLYVVSSTTTVLYCVLAKFSDSLISGQKEAICELYDPHLMNALSATSAADRRQPVPTELTPAEYGYAKDASGMVLAFSIRDGLIGVALRADAPLPGISSARLSVCYVWSNLEKTPTYLYSKNMPFYGLLLKIQGLTSTAVMGMRLSMTTLHQVSSLFKATQSVSLFETREAAGNERGSRYQQLRREMQRQTLESFAGSLLRQRGVAARRIENGAMSAQQATDDYRNLVEKSKNWSKKLVDGDLSRILGLTKKNRMTVFKSGEAKTRRLNASLQHSPTLVAGLANGVRCWYCTPAPTKPAAADSSGTTPAVTDGSAPQAFPARPFETNTKTKFCYPSCNGAFLCQVKRIFILPSDRLVRSGKSCHDLWHTKRVLNPLPLSAKQKKESDDGTRDDDVSPPTFSPDGPAAHANPPPLASTTVTAVAPQDADGAKVLLELASSGRETAQSIGKTVESALGPRQRSFPGGSAVVQGPRRSKRSRKPSRERD